MKVLACVHHKHGLDTASSVESQDKGHCVQNLLVFQQPGNEHRRQRTMTNSRERVSGPNTMEYMHTPIQSPHAPNLLHETRYPDTLHDQQGGSSGGFCSNVQGAPQGLCRQVQGAPQGGLPDMYMHMANRQCGGDLNYFTVILISQHVPPVWMSFLMNWNSTHTSSGVGAYDTCSYVSTYSPMICVTSLPKKNFPKKVKGAKCKVQNVISYMNYTIAIK